MKTWLYISLVLIAVMLFMMVPEAFAQVGTASTSTDASIKDVIDAGGSIPEAFKSGWTQGVLSMFTTLLVLLNFGPVKKFMKEKLKDKLDWLRPLVMTLSGGFAGFVVAQQGGAELVWAVVSGVTLAVGSGAFQKFLLELRD